MGSNIPIGVGKLCKLALNQTCAYGIETAIRVFDELPVEEGLRQTRDGLPYAGTWIVRDAHRILQREREDCWFM